MAHGPEKYEEVQKLLEAGVSVRDTAEQASCSITFVKKVRAAIKDLLPKRKGQRKPKANNVVQISQAGKAKRAADSGQKKTQKDTSGPAPPPKSAWEALSEQKEHKKAQGRKKEPPPPANLNLPPDQIDLEHKKAVRQISSDMLHYYQQGDFNSLKCAKITLEALQIASTMERKWHQIENGNKQKRSFGGLRFEVVGGGSIETEDLPNQDEFNWPNPNK